MCEVFGEPSKIMKHPVKWLGEADYRAMIALVSQNLLKNAKKSLTTRNGEYDGSQLSE
jgi:hypothetical protein